jgi:hypothetical protein
MSTQCGRKRGKRVDFPRSVGRLKICRAQPVAVQIRAPALTLLLSILQSFRNRFRSVSAKGWE